MRKGQSIVVHHTGNYYTASCKMVFWLPGHLAAWLSGHLAVWPSGPYLPKTIALRPAPACLPPYTTNFLLLRLWNSTQNGRKLLLHFIVGQPGKKKSILIPVVPEKSKMMRNPPIKWENVFLLQKCWLRSFEDEKSSSLMSSSTMIYTMRKLSHYY